MMLVATIILYNPDKIALSNCTKLLNCEFFKNVIIIDNSTNDILYFKESSYEKLIYKKYSQNKGIAYALKESLAIANNLKADYILTLDQDSVFPFEQMVSISEYLYNYLLSNVGIVALNYNNKFNTKKDAIFVKQIITSGNFINIKNYNKIDGFNENLFIDYVDFDLCRQFYEKKINIVLLPGFSLEQTIGNPIYKKILFWHVKVMNHSLIRYYYRYRNLYFCFRKNRKFFLKNYLKEKINIVLVVLFEKNKKEKLKIIKKGISDAKSGKLGKYEGEL